MPVKPSVHTIKVSLRHMKPPIWRRLQVPAKTSLAQLHHIIQAAMGWDDCHLHQFEVRELCYAAPEHELDDTRDESRRTLATLPVGERFSYWYDFGDDWHHDILVESIDQADPALTYPRCVTGRRACPPEDSGGPGGFAELMRALGDQNHPQRARCHELIPVDYDPTHFDLNEINDALAHLDVALSA
ncbi:MAG: plasmid pRiA4b ORF-3 family protein [Pseudonocardiaceae bacterium]